MARRTAGRGTALLLVDFINPLDFEGGGRLAAPALRAARRTCALKRKATSSRIPSIYVNDHFGDWRAPFEHLVESVASLGGTAGRIAELLRPAPDDISILKPRHSGFYGTPLEFLLDELGVKRVIVTGLAADNCVLATAQDAYVRKFEVRIPSDCVAAEHSGRKRAILAHMARTLKADIRPFGERQSHG